MAVWQPRSLLTARLRLPQRVTAALLALRVVRSHRRSLTPSKLAARHGNGRTLRCRMGLFDPGRCFVTTAGPAGGLAFASGSWPEKAIVAHRRRGQLHGLAEDSITADNPRAILGDPQQAPVPPYPLRFERLFRQRGRALRVAEHRRQWRASTPDGAQECLEGRSGRRYVVPRWQGLAKDFRRPPIGRSFPAPRPNSSNCRQIIAMHGYARNIGDELKQLPRWQRGLPRGPAQSHEHLAKASNSNPDRAVIAHVGEILQQLSSATACCNNSTASSRRPDFISSSAR